MLDSYVTFALSKIRFHVAVRLFGNREVKHDVYGRRQRLPLIFYSFLVILK